MATFNSQMIYLGNFADMDTNESDSDAELDTLINGTYSKPPLIDVTVEDGNNDGLIPDDELGVSPTEFVSYDLGSGATQQSIDSTIVYDIAVLLGDGSTININGTVIQLQNGDVFLTDYANGGSLDNRNIQSITLSNPNSNFNLFFADSSVDGSSVVCFAPETRIETVDGLRPVSSLTVGDLVLTRDDGAQPIIWINSQATRLPGRHAPIVIQPGAIADGAPTHTLRLSPQHRVLAISPIAERMFASREVFVSAKVLLGLPGVRQANGRQPLTYWHFACDRHQVIKANGIWTETLFPGTEALEALSTPQRNALQNRLSRLPGHVCLARPVPPLRQQRQFVWRLAQNRHVRSLVEVEKGPARGPTAKLQQTQTA